VRGTLERLRSEGGQGAMTGCSTTQAHVRTTKCPSAFRRPQPGQAGERFRGVRGVPLARGVPPARDEESPEPLKRSCGGAPRPAEHQGRAPEGGLAVQL